jgi:hypothetical protein
MYTGSFAAASNAEDWPQGRLQLQNGSTNEIIDPAEADDVTVKIEDWNCCTQISFSLADGTITTEDDPDEGWVMSFHATKAQMQTLCPGTYKVIISAVFNDFTTTIAILDLPIVSGGRP